MINIGGWDKTRQQVGHVIGHPVSLRWGGDWFWLETKDDILKAFALGWEIWQQHEPSQTKAYGAQYYRKLSKPDSIMPKGIGILYV